MFWLARVSTSCSDSLRGDFQVLGPGNSGPGKSFRLRRGYGFGSHRLRTFSGG